jgi:hypothetical protein
MAPTDQTPRERADHLRTIKYTPPLDDEFDYSFAYLDGLAELVTELLTDLGDDLLGIGDKMRAAGITGDPEDPENSVISNWLRAQLGPGRYAHGAYGFTADLEVPGREDETEDTAPIVVPEVILEFCGLHEDHDDQDAPIFVGLTAPDATGPRMVGSRG